MDVKTAGRSRSSDQRRVTAGWPAEVAEQPARRPPHPGRPAAPPRARSAQLAQGRRQVLFAARGSSDNAAVYGRYLLETRAGVLGGLLSPSVATHYRSRLDLSDARWSSACRSPGRPSEIVDTQAWAGANGAATLAVTNVEGSPLAEYADLALVTQAGPELAVAGDQDLPRPSSSRWPSSAPRSPRSRPPSTPSWHRVARRGGAAGPRAARRRRRGRGAAGRGVRRGVGARPDDGHRARDRAQARGDLPAAGARLLLRRPAARTDLGRDLAA